MSFVTLRAQFHRQTSRFSPGGDIELFLKRLGIPLLLLFALCYYGYYCRAWPGPGGEGGVVALLSQRLLEGQKPIVDTFLGYNVLWFYPVVGIFKVLGPHYLAMRLFFFALCLVTGLLSFGVIMKCTGRAWVAFLTGVLVILVPGQTYRNYMAFMAVLNMSVFLSAYVLPSRNLFTRSLWMLLAGITLGIAYLIRIDVGYFLTFIMLGLILLHPLGNPDNQRPLRRILVPLAGLILAGAGFFLTHLPVYRDAVNRGFDREFVGQYRQWPETIASYGSRMIDGTSLMLRESFLKPNAKATPAQVATQAAATALAATPAPRVATPSAATPPPPEKSLKITHGAQERISITSPKPRDKIMALNLYLPIPLSLMMVCGALTAWITAARRGNRAAGVRALSSLTALGCALVLFPQYFFWQPNMVHLSEFMVPMTVALILSCLMVVDSWKDGGGARRLFAGVYLALALAALILYYINGCQSGGGGGIAVSQHKKFPFHAANGADVIMNSEEFEVNSAMRDLIVAVTDPGDFVICYPYHPEINFYTDRPSYEHNVYADNDIPGDKFYRALLANIDRHHPAVFVINNWDINSTEESRFYNWAWEAYRHLTQHYLLGYKHGDFEVYVRPDRAERIPAQFKESTHPSASLPH